MRLLISSLLALLAALAAGWMLSRDSGRVVFSFGEWTVQSSLSLFVLALFLLIIASYFLLRFISGVIHMPASYARWQEHRRYRKSEQALSRGFLSLMEGDWRDAEKKFSKGSKYASHPDINYLLAARAAQQQGEVERRDHYLRLAHDHAGGTSVAVGLTQAELQMNQNQTEQAYATLRHLASESPSQDQIKLMMLETSSELKDWQQSLELLQDLEGKGVMPLERIRAKQLEVHAGLLRNAGESGDRERLEREWRAIPKKLQSELYLIEVYVNERLRFEDTGDCEKMLRRVLKKRRDSALVRLYGLVEGEAPDKQLRFAEKMLGPHSRDAVLLLTVGRLARRNGLWGKARSCFEESIDVHAYPETWHELATLLEQEGDHEGASRCYQQGLGLATYSVPGARRRLEDKDQE
ncbi:MAG: heme biosynthesis HemY N-terminal domain-containing protein [Gammaproteobacteria bacterium]